MKLAVSLFLMTPITAVSQGRPSRKKSSGREGLHQVHVVVEIEEVLRQIRDAVHIQLDGVGAEGRQILLRDEVPVIDDMQLGMVRLQPCRQMSVGQQVYLSHPRGVLLDASEPIAKQTHSR